MHYSYIAYGRFGKLFQVDFSGHDQWGGFSPRPFYRSQPSSLKGSPTRARHFYIAKCFLPL